MGEQLLYVHTENQIEAGREKIDKVEIETGDISMGYNLPEKVRQDIVDIAQKNGVHKVILFGSRARGTNSERSDIDIAVYGGDFDSFYWDINENVWSLLSFDMIEMDKRVSDNLMREIRRDGVIIYEKN